MKRFWLDRLHFYPDSKVSVGEMIIKSEGLELEEIVEIEKKLEEFLSDLGFHVKQK